MAVLHNRVNNLELKQRLKTDETPRITISFYRYFLIEHPKAFRDFLYKELLTLEVLGRIYIASEGINAQISVPAARLESFQTFLNSLPGLSGLRLNTAVEDNGKSFWVLKVKLRDKIVADGISDPSFSMEKKGRYVNAAQMNEMMTDPDTVVIDMRNHYEYEVGHFEQAIEIPSDTFRDQLPMAAEMMKPHAEKNIIMYCTGGIRCEKASAYLMHQGFKNVFHLEGGIIQYTHQIKSQGLENKFIGKNFVFDNRMGESISHHVIAHCHQCGESCDTHVNCRNEACHLLFIQCDACSAAMNGCCSNDCKEFIALPIEVQKDKRKGLDKGRNIFNKSRQRMQDISKSAPDA
jgi:UPF0176 protein